MSKGGLRVKRSVGGANGALRGMLSEAIDSHRAVRPARL
jgi:hypothetical protein